ncbi:hypothetical protein EZV62_025856 [Acer yangbiense]|uniref:Ribosome biogenesis protein NOP53 n=1 Tax=Acer yangbiense TaxID=1000413 RepID=A0A5C7GZF5_9ROSI|nr:hypothetical protein EZV62_025856 [Acer yangbiense]
MENNERVAQIIKLMMKFLRIPEYLSEKNPFVKAVPSSKSKPKKSKKKQRDVLKEKDESLAQVVAEEMQKVYQNELGPEPIPFTVPGHAIDDEDVCHRYFLEVDNASDDDGNVENLSENAHENRSIKTKRVTQVELNKNCRRKKQKQKRWRNLPDIIQEIAKEDKENKKRHLRCLVATQETESSSTTLGKAQEIEDSLTYKIGSGLASGKGYQSILPESV